MKFLTNITCLIFSTFWLQAEEKLPVEFLRLQEQYQAKVKATTTPLREVYKQEIKKMQDRMVRENRLAEALAMKNFLDTLDGPQIEEEKPVEKVAAKSPEELKTILGNTWWVTYSIADEKRKTALDVICFQKDGAMTSFGASTDPWPWTCKSNKVAHVDTGGEKSYLFFFDSKIEEAQLQIDGAKNWIAVRVSTAGRIGDK